MRKQKKERGTKTTQNHLELTEIKALTENQQRTFDAWDDEYNLVLSGSAGTGKSFLAIYLALDAIKDGDFQQLVIIRSAVASRNIGFLPGSAKEKVDVFEEPYRAMVNELYGRGDAYEVLKTKKIIDFKVTSFLRGTTINNAVILVDEFQNLSSSENGTVITRAGEGTKMIFAGDFEQSDLFGREKYETLTTLKILDRMSSFTRVNFDVEDIVRSGLCKEYLIAKKEVEQDDHGSQYHGGAVPGENS